MRAVKNACFTWSGNAKTKLVSPESITPADERERKNDEAKVKSTITLITSKLTNYLLHNSLEPLWPRRCAAQQLPGPACPSDRPKAMKQVFHAWRRSAREVSIALRSLSLAGSLLLHLKCYTGARMKLEPRNEERKAIPCARDREES